MPVTLTRPFIHLTAEQLEERLKKCQPGNMDYSSYLAEIEQRKVDADVHRAARPHWVDWATFAVAIVACLTTVLTFAISIIVYREQLARFLQAWKF